MYTDGEAGSGYVPTGTKKFFSHPVWFGRASVTMRLWSWYAYLAFALGFGLLLGASPLTQGLLWGKKSESLINGWGWTPKSSIVDTNALKSNPLVTLSGLRSKDLLPRQGTTTSALELAPRLLFMTATYTMGQLAALQQQFDGLRDICNAGWDVSIHIDSASELTYEHPRFEGKSKFECFLLSFSNLVRIALYLTDDISCIARSTTMFRALIHHPHICFTEFRKRMWCSRTEAEIPISVTAYSKIGFGLNSKHRIVLRQRLQEFDYFSFAEEDMILSISHLQTFQKFTARMKKHFPQTYLRYTLGFLRYEDSTLDSERVSWEYRPQQIHVVDLGYEVGKYIVTTNLNQAIYLFSQEQVLDLEQRCGFLSDPGQNAFYRELRRAMDKDWKYISAGVSEWSSSFQHVLQCGVRRLIPVDHFEQSMIHHATDKAQHRRPRNELLNAVQLQAVVEEKMRAPITIDEAYNTLIFQQYNLHLMDKAKFDGKSLWSWEVPKETNK